MAVLEERWEKWLNAWNGMKKEEFQAYIEGEEDAQLAKIAPEELQIKIAQKWTRFYGTPLPIELEDKNPEAEEPEKSDASAGLPSEADKEAIAKINHEHQKGIVEDEVGRQADLLDAADKAAITKRVILTEQQQFIASLVDAAEAEAPTISVNELSQRLMMLIPQIVIESRPEYSYKWADAANLQSELHTFGGMWEVVAKVNHGHLPAKMFGPEGSIMYKGASILVFTRRSTTEFLDKQTIKELDLRVRESTQNMSKTYRDPRGREQVHLEIIDKEPPNRIGNPVPLKEETFGPEGDYDFSDTGTEN